MTERISEERLKFLAEMPPTRSDALAQECRSMARELLELRKLREWRPISEAPKDGTTLLLWIEWYGAHEPEIGSWVEAHEGWYVRGHSRKVVVSVTKWQPLPSPPSASEGGE